MNKRKSGTPKTDDYEDWPEETAYSPNMIGMIHTLTETSRRKKIKRRPIGFMRDHWPDEEV